MLACPFPTMALAHSKKINKDRMQSGIGLSNKAGIRSDDLRVCAKQKDRGFVIECAMRKMTPQSHSRSHQPMDRRLRWNPITYQLSSLSAA